MNFILNLSIKIRNLCIFINILNVQIYILLFFNFFRSENDEFRRNHYLTSLLHVKTKCEILQKKLSKDYCPIFRQNVKLLPFFFSSLHFIIIYSLIGFIIINIKLFDGRFNSTWSIFVFI